MTDLWVDWKNDSWSTLLMTFEDVQEIWEVAASALCQDAPLLGTLQGADYPPAIRYIYKRDIWDLVLMFKTWEQGKGSKQAV